jgi:hypothetical protein
VRRLFTARWVAVHFGVLLLVAAFLGLAWWQITRAAQGNALSFGYAIEWPVFAAFVVAVWIVEMRKVVREQTTEAQVMTAQSEDVRPESEPVVPARRRRPRNEAAYDDSDDPQLAAYNHYLGWLNAHPYASPADYPGTPAPDPTPVTAKESS